MARTVWKGFLSLERVSCAVRLHPALTRMERMGFQGLNRTTLNRVQMRAYDPQTGKEVGRDALLRGYEVEPGRFVVLDDRELAELQLESSRNIVLERFIEPGTVDPLYFDTPYFLVPEAETAAAFAVIRTAMARAKRIGLGRIILANRERASLVAPRGHGLLLTTLHSAVEVRHDESAFGDFPDPALPEGLIEAASWIIAQRSGSFDPRRDFRDRYQEALVQLAQAKLRGEKPVFPERPAPVTAKALAEAMAESLIEERKSVAAGRDAAAKPRSGR